MRIFLTTEEKKAILSVAIMMQVSDGDAALEESFATVAEALRMGLDPVASFEECSNPNSFKPAINCVSKMSFEKKKYVFSVLYKVMVSDGKIDPRESRFLNIISEEAGLPNMSPSEVDVFLHSVE